MTTSNVNYVHLTCLVLFLLSQIIQQFISHISLEWCLFI
uniref:Uncharacterized protein n=1 Tax=Anguilla anguilla TaxID=7936 RepID=A0A0E9UF32_ANGAN